MQVVEDHTARVDLRESVFHPCVDVEGPGGVLGQSPLPRVGLDERVAAGEEGVERLAVDVLQDEEVMLPDRAVVQHLGRAVEARQPFQRPAFAVQPGHGVGPVGRQTGVRTGLLEDDPVTGAGVTGEVDATAVGEVQRRLDGVGQAAHRHRGAGVEVRTEEGGRLDPLRDAEDRAAQVGHQHTVGTGHGRPQLPVRVVAVAPGEAAEADVHGAVADAQVTQDVRAGLAGQQVGQLPRESFALRLVGRVHGDELAAAGPVRVLGVALVQQIAAGHELEGRTAGDAVPPHAVEHGLRVVEAGGDMDLPPLRGQIGVDRAQREPVPALVALPSVRHRPGGRGVPGARCAGPVGRAVRGVVEVRVRVAVHGIALVHAYSLPPVADRGDAVTRRTAPHSCRCHHSDVRNARVTSREEEARAGDFRRAEVLLPGPGGVAMV
ncbi:hypothetical protein STENM327S_00474 [Streptomyces tendae]